MRLDGSMTHMQLVRGIAGGGQIAEKLWPQMTSTEQTCALHACARKNRYIRERPHGRQLFLQLEAAKS